MNITKYHGLGNDFIITTEDQIDLEKASDCARILCDRHTGIGADGLIIVSQQPLTMVYYNSDGSRAEMCGNGIRCFAKYCHDHQITSDRSFDVSTLAGMMKIEIKSVSPFLVEVDMGTPNYQPTSIPVLTDRESFINRQLIINGELLNVSSLLLGVPHTVLEVENLAQTDLVKVGEQIATHSLFPKGTNVNFYQVHSNQHISMQTFERGAGLTLACGTGACAVAAYLQDHKGFERTMTVSLPLGDLIITRDGNRVRMTGEAVKVFEGNFEVKQ